MALQGAQHIIYLYDLPKDKITSVKIAEAFKANADVTLTTQPQIRRDQTRPFFSAMVKIQDTSDYNKACEKMRFFDIDGKPCRLLPFDKDLLGTNRAKI